MCYHLQVFIDDVLAILVVCVWELVLYELAELSVLHLVVDGAEVGELREECEVELAQLDAITVEDGDVGGGNLDDGGIAD